MNFENIIFYSLFFFVIISSSSVILSNNAVYSVLFLILTFSNVVLLLLLLGAEFFAFLLLIVYVGAIAVLFLFVVMMLNIKITKSFNQIHYFSPLFLIFILFIIDYFYNFTIYFDSLKDFKQLIYWFNWIDKINFKTNINVIGDLLYTNYSFLFILASLILLVAMVGVILLTVNQKNIFDLKKQKINFQLTRNPKKVIKFLKIRR